MFSILSRVGGLYNLLRLLALQVGSYYSYQKFYSTMINALYFSKSIDTVKFVAKDSIGKNRKIFKKAKQKVLENLDIVNHLIQFQKIKSVLMVLVKDNQKLVENAKQELERCFNLDKEQDTKNGI
jgi:hypothetical protein